MAKQKHQKAVIAGLLVTPSTLHKHWKAGDKAKVTDELDRLKLSKEAKDVAQTAMDNIDKAAGGLKGKFTEVATFLRTEIWEGDEPHPNDDEALALSKKAKELDGEV